MKPVKMKSKNNRFSVSFLALILFIVSCNQGKQAEKNTEAVIDESSVQVSETNPNGDSELAILMRTMFEEGEKIKTQIVSGEGNISPEYIEMIEKCHTAVPTDPDVKTEEFTAFNNLLSIEANKLLIPETDIKAGFNEMVNRCMDCHDTFCPGPMKRIRKLYIK